jgi:phosphate starvation-inducible protein PhoH and related proteins
LPERGLEALFGPHDQNIKYLESLLSVRVGGRGAELIVEGDEADVATVERILKDYGKLFNEGRTPSASELRDAFKHIADDRASSLREVLDGQKRINPAGRKQVTARGPNQKRYLEAIEKDDIVFGIGPAGTGKTFLAVAMAVQYLMSKRVNRIVLARPAVEAGEKLGFLPGDLQDKVDPYLRPLYDALYDLLDYDRVSRLLERNAIEVAPIAFMRGRTLNDAFVIIDEAQNTTTEQMKMVLTRIGFGSKVVITGDITQIDLPAGRTSGLVEAIAVLSGVKGISFVYFDEKDVVRHKLVQSVIKAYDAYGASQAPSR